MPVLDKKTLRRIFLGVSGCIILYWLLHETERVNAFFGIITGIMAPFVFGGVLAFILNVPMRSIETFVLRKVAKHTLKRILSVILTLLVVLLVVSLVFWLLIPQIVSTVNTLIPSLYDFFMDSEKFVMDFLRDNPQLKAWLVENTDFENANWGSLVENGLTVFGNSVSTIVSGTISAISSIFAGVFNAFIAIVFCIYCLFQKETLARQGRKLLYAFFKEKTADSVVRILRLTNSTFSNFLSGQCLEVCILGTLFAVCMAIFRMPYIPLISVVIAVTAFIPIVGAWTGCVVGAFLILVKDPMLAVVFVIMFLVLQLVENNLIYPRVVGTSVGLSGMWVLVAVSVGGELMGVIGMFLMIPMVSVLYSILQEVTNKKLSASSIDSEKLRPQPPVLVSKLKDKRKDNKKKHKEVKPEETDNKE